MSNIDSLRDWGYAKEYVESMWLMLQQDDPNDYVIATGIGASVSEFCEIAFNFCGLDAKEYVKKDIRYHRPNEVISLIGNSDKAKNELNWRAKTTWKELAQIMVEADLELEKSLSKEK